MRDASLQQQLRSAIDRGDADRVSALIAEGADVNCRGNDPDGETPLIRAIAADHLSVVRVLIEAGANVNAAERLNGWTPLMFARENPVVMLELIAAGADVNVRTSIRELVSPVNGKQIRRGGETALHLTATTNNAEAVRILIRAGAEIEARDVNGLAPLDVALEIGSPTESAVALVEAGAKLTPERLEMMHGGAHEPHSDLRFFPEAGEMPSRTKTENTGPPDAGKMSVEPAKGEHREFKCPNCGGLVYSRKARVCGNCGETLSPEVGLSVDQRRLLDEQREWARDLADRFGTQNPRVTSRNSARPAAAEGIVRPMSWTAELLRRKSCAEEFRTRDRPDFWLYVAGYIFLLAISAFAFVAVGHFSPLALSVMIGLCAFYCYRAWQHATPICPNCQENIRSCAPFYCHICGNPLEDQRCGNCRVNYSRNSLLFSFANDGNSGLVAYCPACGVELRTRIRRRGERGLSLTENRK